MQPIQTGIAVALAVAVVAIFFIFPGLSPFAVSTGEMPTSTTITMNTQPATTSPMNNATELQASDEVVGTGATAMAGDTVTVQYVGALTNGTIFDASANHSAAGYTFILGSGKVIRGWDLGLVGMKEGGRRILVIPASLAYGSQTIGEIPPNSTLIFQVELVRVQKAQ